MGDNHYHCKMFYADSSYKMAGHIKFGVMERALALLIDLTLYVAIIGWGKVGEGGLESHFFWFPPPFCPYNRAPAPVAKLLMIDDSGTD